MEHMDHMETTGSDSERYALLTDSGSGRFHGRFLQNRRFWIWRVAIVEVIDL
jgi:hypothetical protein